MHMKADGSNIEGVNGHAITPSNTLRMKPWGGAFDSKPNGKVNSTAESNSEIIAINNSVLEQLADNDVRDVRNYYFMMGNTWTKGGAAPNGPYPGSEGQLKGQEVGTSLLANSTMETYQQGTTLAKSGSNCFGCHTTNTTAVSHIYEELRPLF